MQDVKLGKSGPLEISAAPSAVVCAILLAAALAAVAYFLLHLSIFESVAGGLVATFFHYDAELWHQHGHASAASQAGYPMTGIRLWTIFSQSIYPPDEPELPAETHIKRALGGPRYSLIMTAGAALMAGLVYSISGPTDWIFYIFLFFFLDNLLFFTLGSFLPLGFTDGSTLLHWWPRRGSH
jgi:hypothetical protein